MFFLSYSSSYAFTFLKKIFEAYFYLTEKMIFEQSLIHLKDQIVGLLK